QAQLRERLERGAQRTARLDRFRGRQIPDRRLWGGRYETQCPGRWRQARPESIAAPEDRAWRVRDASSDRLRLFDRDGDRQSQPILVGPERTRGGYGAKLRLEPVRRERLA